MKIQLLKDFRGKETNETYHKSGAVITVDNEAHAQRLIGLGFAVEVKEVEAAKIKAVKAEPKK